MSVRKIVEGDLVVGNVIISRSGRYRTIKKVDFKTNRVFYGGGGFDYINREGSPHVSLGIIGGYEIEDKPTGIPTFDGDLPQGTKLDQGKLKPTLLLDDMPLAINEILKVLQFGAEKYSEGNWLKVPNGIDRYRNAADRHRLAIDELDDESGMMHLAHEATSVLMLLELKLREKRDAE